MINVIWETIKRVIADALEIFVGKQIAPPCGPEPSRWQGRWRDYVLSDNFENLTQIPARLAREAISASRCEYCGMKRARCGCGYSDTDTSAQTTIDITALPMEDLLILR